MIRNEKRIQTASFAVLAALLTSTWSTGVEANPTFPDFSLNPEFPLIWTGEPGATTLRKDGFHHLTAGDLRMGLGYAAASKSPVTTLRSSGRPLPRPRSEPQPVAEVALLEEKAESVATPDAPVTATSVAPASKLPDALRDAFEKKPGTAAALDRVPRLKTADVAPEHFSRMREAAILAAGGTEATPEARVELARVLLGGGFAHEAAGVATEAVRDHPDMAQSTRLSAAAIALAASLIGGPATELAREISRADWEDPRLWPVAAAIAARAPVSSLQLRTAAATLGEQSPPVITALFPGFFEAAIRADDIPLARQVFDTGIMAGMQDQASLANYMRGLLAKAQGDEEEAFDYLAKASEINDVHGARARVAIADIVQGRDDRRMLADLRTILADGVQRWRGDDVARQMMIRLAGITEELADAPAALRTMTAIIAEFPGTPEERLARERIPVVLRSFALEAEKGQADYRTYLLTLRELERQLTVFPEWAEARAVLARLQAGQGLHSAAAAEYAALRSDLAGGTPATLTADEVRALEAEQRILAGEQEQARAAMQGREPQDALQQRVAAELGVLRPEEELSGIQDEAMIALARHAYHSGDMATAARAYGELDTRGKSLSGADVVRYFHSQATSAKNVGHVIVSGNASHGDLDDITLAAETMVQEMPDISRLTTGTARLMLDRAGKAAAMADAVGSAGGDAGEKQ